MVPLPGLRQTLEPAGETSMKRIADTTGNADNCPITGCGKQATTLVRYGFTSSGSRYEYRLCDQHWDELWQRMRPPLNVGLADWTNWPLEAISLIDVGRY